jgi:F-type H+-transporting ATPase subunit a
MGLEFLARIRRSSLWLGTVAALFAAAYSGLPLGIGLGVGVLWSVLNLMAVESLVVSLTGPARGTAPTVRKAALTVGGMLPLFAGGAFALFRLPLAPLAIGFTLPFAVMALKAASLLLLPSNAWRRVTRDPRWALGALVLLGAGAWLATAPLRSTGSPARAAVTTAAAEHRAPAAHESAHAEEESGPQKFPNFITVLHRAFPNAGWVSFLHHYEAVVFSLLIALILGLIAWAATRNAQMVPSGLQNVVESLVEALHDFVVGILGPKHGPRYVPFLGTLFLYILAMNLFGLIPFMESPTSSLNVTVALALTVFVYSQWIGLRELGILGWIDHLAGSPRNVTGWALVPIMLPIHILGELAKPISLACRLFGNVFGEDMLLVAFASLGVTVLSFTHLPFGFPLQLPFLVLALLTSTLQALVFTVLSTIYILLMLPHDDHGHEEVAHSHEGGVP